jgi:hypothetical protein
MNGYMCWAKYEYFELSILISSRHRSSFIFREAEFHCKERFEWRAHSAEPPSPLKSSGEGGSDRSPSLCSAQPA